MRACPLYNIVIYCKYTRSEAARIERQIATDAARSGSASSLMPVAADRLLSDSDSINLRALSPRLRGPLGSLWGETGLLGSSTVAALVVERGWPSFNLNRCQQ